MSSWVVDCQDARSSLNGVANNETQDASNSSSNGFIPIGHIQQVYCDNSGSTVDRSDPLWQEVAKRYQEIIEKEHKLLGQYYDDQAASQATTVTPTLNAPLVLKGRNGHHSRGLTKVASCKPTENGTETGNVATQEYNYNNRTTKNTMNNDNLPKIVEVYSLNPVNIQDEVSLNQKATGVIVSHDYGLNKNDRHGFPYKDEEDSKTDDHTFTKQAVESSTQDPNPFSPCPGEKSPLASDNFIDLTVEEEEETSAYEDAVSTYENYLAENTATTNHQPTEGTGDKGRELETKPKRNKNKRKGGFGYKRKRKRQCPTKCRELKTSNSLSSGLEVGVMNSNNVEGRGGGGNLCKRINDNKEDHCNDGCKQNVRDKNNNNDWRKKQKNGIKKETNDTFSSNCYNSDVNVLLSMSYRENKITTLKARLAKQEEELARLRIQKKESILGQENHKNLEAPCTYSSPATSDTKVHLKQTEHTDNFNTESFSNRKEEDDSEIVTLDDICQHVIKSFDIFNARQVRNKQNADLHSSKIPKKNTFVLKQEGSDNCRQREQDIFLLQVGLKRRSFSSN